MKFGTTTSTFEVAYPIRPTTVQQSVNGPHVAMRVFTDLDDALAFAARLCEEDPACSSRPSDVRITKVDRTVIRSRPR